VPRQGDGTGVQLGRRALLTLGAASFFAPSAACARDGFVIDWQGGDRSPEIAASLEAQIRIVETLPISMSAMDFFRAEPIHVDRRVGGRTRAGRGVFFAREVQPPDNPVLLHELIHRWQLARMGGPGNPAIARFYAAARASGAWPAGSYMLSNPFEFFAMCASVVLHGRAARPPFTRAAVKRAMPELYVFILREFGARLD
jgi:hypothetical protein